MTRRSRISAIAALALVTLAGACAPPPSAAPTWAPTVKSWSEAAGAPLEQPFAATSSQWWAVVEVPSGWEGGATLHLHRRTGPRGAPAPSPAFSFGLAAGASDLAMSEHVVAVRTRTPVDGSVAVELFELDGTVWSAAATIPRSHDPDRDWSLAVTDAHVVLGGRGRSNLPHVAGAVTVVPITLTGDGIGWSPASTTSLVPDPAWPEPARNGFGAEVSVNGGTLAVGTASDRVALYRAVGSAWAPDGTLQAAAPLGGGAVFGRALSVDASDPDRVAVGSGGGFDFGVPRPGRVEVFRRGGSGWLVEATIGPREGSALNGLGMGGAVALDGDRLAVSAHWVPVPRPGGIGAADDLRIEVHDLAAVPTFRTELSLLGAIGGLQAYPHLSSISTTALDLAGNHLSAAAFVGFGSGPSHYAAVSFDRG